MYIKKWREQIRVSPIQVAEAQRLYTALSKNKDYKLRVENESITVYSQERDWLYNLAVVLDVQEWWEPESELTPGVLIMGPKMTGWEYKVTLGIDVPSTFCQWAVANSDKLKIGNKLLQMLQSGHRHYYSGYYFYVRNEKMLNLINLVIGSGIQRIDKIVVDDRSA